MRTKRSHFFNWWHWNLVLDIRTSTTMDTSSARIICGPKTWYGTCSWTASERYRRHLLRQSRIPGKEPSEIFSSSTASSLRRGGRHCKYLLPSFFFFFSFLFFPFCLLSLFLSLFSPFFCVCICVCVCVCVAFHRSRDLPQPLGWIRAQQFSFWNK